jgi:hypothetical protein
MQVLFDRHSRKISISITLIKAKFFSKTAASAGLPEATGEVSGEVSACF